MDCTHARTARCAAKLPILEHVLTLPQEAVPGLAFLPVPLQEDQGLVSVSVQQRPQLRHVHGDVAIKLNQPVLGIQGS